MSQCFVRKVIVIGGSSGAIQSLCKILKELPSSLDAAILTVIHTTEESHHLPKVLENCGALPVVCPAKAESIRPGNIYLAAPNRHLVVNSYSAVSWMGPRENRHRPSVDALFRTAARVYRGYVIAVILSGALDDGSAGALAVKGRGGTVIVQDPNDALVKDMPENVLRCVKADHCVPLQKIPALLVSLVSKGKPIKAKRHTSKYHSANSESPYSEIFPPGLTCPECGGIVTKLRNGKNTVFRCHVGHAFSLASFTEAHAEALERTLWGAMRKLNEQKLIQEHLAQGAEGSTALKSDIVKMQKQLHVTWNCCMIF
jgi:two-component system chemotaxis response regulator CheB